LSPEAKTVAILPLVRQNWLKWSHGKLAVIHKRQGPRLEIGITISVRLTYSSHVVDRNKTLKACPH